jgi:hypothetical protein
MKTYLTWFTILLVVVLPVFQSRSAPAAAFVEGEVKLIAHIQNRDVIVLMRTTQLKAESYPYKRGFRWGAEDREPPQTLLASVNVSVEGVPVFVSLSAYCDLADPRKASLKQTDSGFVLTITGGDAASAYEAILTFENGNLVRRRVSSREFPKEAWERTEYLYNTLDK